MQKFKECLSCRRLCRENTKQIAKPTGGGGGSTLHYEIPPHSLFSPAFTSFGANLSLQWPACPKLNTKISALSYFPYLSIFQKHNMELRGNKKFSLGEHHKL